MNVLQIEFFKGSIFYVINSMQEINVHTLLGEIEVYIEQMKKFTVTNDVKIQVLFHINENQILINNDNAAQVMIYNYRSNTVEGFSICFMDDLNIKLRKFLKKDKHFETVDLRMDISKYNCLVFSKKAFQQICQVTQQFLNYKELFFDKSLTLCVQTSAGIEKLFDNGKSKSVQNQIIDITDWKGLQKHDIDDCHSLYVLSLNNFISSICIDNGEYTMSLKAIDNKEKKCTILHLKCMVEKFWLNLYETNYQKEKYVSFLKPINIKSW